MKSGNNVSFWRALASSAVLVLILSLSGQSVQNAGPIGDYGDAPDSLFANYLFSDPFTEAVFPSTFSQSNNAGFILHRFPEEQVFLGNSVTSEDNAQLVDKDEDNGWLPGSFAACSLSEFQVQLTVPESADSGPIYFNALFDWDHNGQWAGTSDCSEVVQQQTSRETLSTQAFVPAGTSAPEWGIQNLRLDEPPFNLEPGFSGTITLPPFLAGNLAGELWARITVTRERVTDVLNSAGWNGHGDFLFGETEDYFSCLVTDQNGLPVEGCPNVLPQAAPADPTPAADPPPNGAPQAFPNTVTTPEDAPVNIALNATDPDNDPLSFSIVSPPFNGTLVGSGNNVTYIPNLNFSGTDTFIFQVDDGNGATSAATVTILVTPAQDPPVANDVLQSTPPNTPLSLQLPVGDPDGDPLSCSLVSGASNGNVVVNPNCTATFTPNNGFLGTDTFIFQVSDGNGGTDTGTVTVDVSPTAPTANPQNVATPEDTALNITLTGSDPNGDPLTFSVVNVPGNGTLTGFNPNSGALSYTPNANFSGTDTFVFQVDDGNGGSDTATVTITVNAVNDPPTAVDDLTSTAEDTPVSVQVLSNDSDPEGDPLSIASVGTPTGGAVVINGNQIDYTPNANFNGTDSFTYTVSDGNSGSDTATVTITVNAVNDPPTAVNDSTSTSEDVPVAIAVLGNDSDPENDPLNIDSVTQPAHGLVVVNGSQVDYTPELNFNGFDTFTYTVSDGNGGSDTAIVTVTVNAVNDPPVALIDNVTTDEDTSVSVDVLANDSDPENDPLTITSVGAPANGTAVINAAKVDYTPNANFNGTDSFTYTISDGNGGSSTATANVTVNPINDPPVALDDSASTPLDTPVSVDVLANDSDLESDPLTVTSVGTPTNGTAVINAGKVDYTPSTGFVGTDLFTYIVSDGNGGSSTAAVTVTVGSGNNPPTAVDDGVSTPEDTSVSVDVLANDSDPENDPLTIASVGVPANGTAVINAGKVDYVPNTNFNGTDSFTYTVSDGNGGSATATVTITVNPVNDPPTAIDDSASTPEDTSVTVDVLADDTDPDGDPLSITSVGTPTSGTAVINAAKVDYTPNANFNGTDSFTYTVSDGNGGSATATVTITVNPVNDPPIALGDNTSTLEDTTVSVDVLANDADPDGDTLNITSAGAPTNGTAVINAGKVDYTPNANFNGTDSFTYTVSDGNGGSATATVTITVTAVNDPPTALDDSTSTPENTLVSVDVLTNDADPDGDTLSVSLVGTPTNGTAVINAGKVDYTPNANFNGTDSFTYTVSDGNGGSATATVTVTVNAVNNPPTALNDSASTPEDTLVSVAVLANDSDPENDPLTITNVGTPANGTVAINGSQIEYTPALNFNGTDSFTYTISDGNGGSDTAIVNITVDPVNDPPITVDDTVSTAEDTPAIVAVLGNDTDPDGDTLTITSAGTPTNGTAVINGNQVVYRPNLNFNGTDSFTYTVSDGNGGSATATVTVTVNPVNDSPVALDDSASTIQGTPIGVAVLGNDTDPDGDTLTITSVGTPTSGTVVINGTQVDYAPNANFSGTDSFTYTVSDGNGSSATATVTVTVGANNGPPSAVDDSASTNEDTPVSVAVLANDSDPENDPLTIASVGVPTSGTATVNAGKVDYVPNANFNGTDSFTYTVSDGNGGSATATVTVTINPVNDPPVALDDSASTSEDTSVSVAVLDNDSDLDGDLLTITGVVQPLHGLIAINGSQVDYTPEPNFSGPDAFSYSISDGHGGSATATVSVTVTPINDPPVALDDSASTPEDTLVSVAVLGNDTDPENDVLSVASVGTPTNGTAQINGNQIDYTPNLNFFGTDSFTYTISDGNGGSDTATVTITVTEVNDPPTAIADPKVATTPEDTPIDLHLTGSDPDVGDVLTFSIVTPPTHGSLGPLIPTVSVNTLYTPELNFVGTDTFEFKVDDGRGGTDTALVTIVVTPVNDPPVAQDDSAATDEDTMIDIGVLGNDTDPDGDLFSIVSLTQPAHGAVSINVGGMVDYAPAPNFNGLDSFTYTIDDGKGGSSTATVTVTVNAVNDPPIALDDSTSTAEDTATSISVLGNDTDPDNDPLTITSVTVPTSGTAVINGTQIDYTPALNFNGSDGFTYTISDGNGGVATATVAVTVNAVNDLPVAQDDITSTNEDTLVSVAVLGNDTDPDGDSLSISGIGLPSHGTAAINGAQVDYTPELNFNGSDSFTYTVSDGHGGTDSASVIVSIGASNDPPVAVNDDASIPEDTSVSVLVLTNDSDPDNDPLTLSGIGSVANGTVVINGAQLDYTPNPNFFGVDSFTYTVSDGNGGSASATVNVSVLDVNDPPVANANGPYVCTVGTPIDLSSAGSFDIDGTIVSFAWDLDDDGSFETSGANPSFSCTTDGVLSLALQVTDDKGATATGSATLVASSVSDLEISKQANRTNAAPGETLNYMITVSNHGPSPVTGATVSDDVPALLQGVHWVCSASNGSCGASSGDGNINTTLDLNSGGAATFVVTGTISDSAVGTISNVATVNAPPGTTDPGPSANTTPPITTTVTPTANLSITKSANQANLLPGAALSYTITVSNHGPSAVSGATVSDNLPVPLQGVHWVCSASSGSCGTSSGDGNINTTVNLDNGGTATFVVAGTVSNDAVGTISNTAVVNTPPGTVDPAPGDNTTPPVITVVTPSADLSVTKAVDQSSVKPRDALSYTITVFNHGPSAVTGATVSDDIPVQLHDVHWVCSASSGSCGTSSGDGNVNTTVNLDNGGTATFVVTGKVSEDATGTISNVASVATPPGTTDPTPNDNTTPPVLTTVDSSCSSSDEDNDGDDNGGSCDDDDNDGISDDIDMDDDNDGTPDTEDACPFDASEHSDNDHDGTCDNADLDDDNDGTPDSEDAFPFDSSESHDHDHDGTGDNADLDDDNDGTPDSEDAFPFDPAKHESNSAPTANDKEVEAQKGVSLLIQLEGSDSDGNPISYTIVSSPSKGTISGFDPNSGTLIYTADKDKGKDSFTFRTNDGSLDSKVATVRIKLKKGEDEHKNKAPKANGQEVKAQKGIPLFVQLIGSDPDGNPISYSIVSNPSKGTISGFDPNSGTLIYTADKDKGNDSFSFKTNDGSLDSKVATVKVKLKKGPKGSDSDKTCKSIQSLTLQYLGSDPATEAHVTGDKGLDVTVALDANKMFTVNAGDKFPAFTTFAVGSDATTIHTSCSIPIGPGMTFGNFLIVSWVFTAP